MAKLTLVERTRLNLRSVSVVVAGGAPVETDMLIQVFTGFGTGCLLRADNIQEIKSAIEHKGVDLIVLDLRLGAPAASELLGWLRRQGGSLKMTPTVLVGAHVTPTTISAARNSGADYVIVKPITPQVMFERLIWIAKETRRFIEADSFAGPDRRARTLGPPVGMAGRRKGDLSSELGDASTPNMSQADIDAMLMPARKVS